MKLSTDHSFHIGEQHIRQGKPCQDYALSGSLGDETAYAIVSDGCSSGGMTDIGSRLMSLASLRAIEEYAAVEQVGKQPFVIARDAYLESYRASLHLSHRDLLATALQAVANKHQVQIDLTGDGVVALHYERGLLIRTFSWANNTPYYPAYRLAGLTDQFTNSFGSVTRPFTEEVFFSEGNTSDLKPEPAHYSAQEGVPGSSYTVWIDDTELGKLKTVALFSDGVEQIDGIDTVEAVTALLSFKSTSGQFAVRRMNRYLQEVKKLGRGPIDDIAYAVIHLEHNEEADHASDQTSNESNP